MRLLLANYAAAIVVLAGVAWGVQDMRRQSACAYRALNIIDAAMHHVPGPTIAALREGFDREC